jgi:hypothetical protein
MKIVIYSWFGEEELVFPYKHNDVMEVTEDQLWTIVKDFYMKRLSVMVRRLNKLTLVAVSRDTGRGLFDKHLSIGRH